MGEVKAELITVTKAREILGMSNNTIIRYFDSGLLKGIAKTVKTGKRPRRTIWIERTSVENFFNIPEDVTV